MILRLFLQPHLRLHPRLRHRQRPPQVLRRIAPPRHLPQPGPRRFQLRPHLILIHPQQLFLLPRAQSSRPSEFGQIHRGR